MHAHGNRHDTTAFITNSRLINSWPTTTTTAVCEHIPFPTLPSRIFRPVLPIASPLSHSIEFESNVIAKELSLFLNFFYSFKVLRGSEIQITWTTWNTWKPLPPCPEKFSPSSSSSPPLSATHSRVPHTPKHFTTHKLFPRNTLKLIEKTCCKAKRLWSPWSCPRPWNVDVSLPLSALFSNLQRYKYYFPK